MLYLSPLPGPFSFECYLIINLPNNFYCQLVQALWGACERNLTFQLTSSQTIPNPCFLFAFIHVAASALVISVLSSLLNFPVSLF